MLKSFKFVFLTCFVAVVAVSAQVIPVTAEEIVKKTEIQRSAYISEFRNLLSEETKTFETFGSSGDVKKKRTIKSVFVVYQLSKDENQTAEYRNVVAVDGKQLDKAEQRAKDFFEKIANVESTKKELERIGDESSRFDIEISLTGLTLFQAIVLAENMRPYFEFKLDGTEKIEGNDVYVVDYRQIKESPYIIINSNNNKNDGKLTLNQDANLDGKRELSMRINGKFYIDAKTFRVRRETQSSWVKPRDFEKALLLSEKLFDYQDSSFGILTPRKISHTEYKLSKKGFSTKQVRVTFDYEQFTKPDVDVNSSEVK